jgi:hypothetical protein
MITQLRVFVAEIYQLFQFNFILNPALALMIADIFSVNLLI